MTVPSTPSHAPATSLTFITIGAILAVLAGTSYFYFPGDTPAVMSYIRACALILGLALVGIGFGVGHIGRSAREAEVPPQVTQQGAPASQTVTPGGSLNTGAAGAQPPAAGGAALYSSSSTGDAPKHA